MKMNTLGRKNTPGILLIALSLFMLMGFFNAQLSSPITAFLAFLIAVVLPGGIGTWLLYQNFQQSAMLQNRKESLANQTLESEILKYAHQQDGRLTVFEVSRHFSLSEVQAESLLDQLAQRKQADYQITDTGLIVYVFEGVQQLSDKMKSKRLEDA